MIELQRVNGMRPGEACPMTTGAIDRDGKVWAYTPARHKTEHHGRSRVIFLGPKTQGVVKPWLRTDPDAYLFSPAEAVAERRASQRAARKSKVQPSQIDRGKVKPKRSPGAAYDSRAYAHSIARACRTAGVPMEAAPWSLTTSSSDSPSRVP